MNILPIMLIVSILNLMHIAQNLLNSRTNRIQVYFHSKRQTLKEQVTGMPHELKTSKMLTHIPQVGSEDI